MMCGVELPHPLDVACALREGRLVEDVVIDALLSDASRLVSATYWTPVAVARLAADWISAAHARRVLDVGSGVGKFCLVAALASELRVTGVEQRAHLVTEARRLAAQLGVEDRVEFAVGTLTDIDAASFDALYVFNPFSEHLYPADARLDLSVEMSPERMARDVAVLERVLDQMRIGAVFVTFHGFRGTIPDTFDLTRWERTEQSVLRLWTKAREHVGGFRWAEVDDDLTLVPQP